jgi:hypothetical protein
LHVAQIAEVEELLRAIYQPGQVVVFEWLQWLQFSLLDHIGAAASLQLHAQLTDLYARTYWVILYCQK